MFICSKCGTENYPGISYFEKAKEPGKIWITCRNCGTFAIHPYEGAQSLDIPNLKRQGLAVVDTLRHGLEAAVDAYRSFVVRPIPEGESDQFYVKLLARLAGVQLTEESAEEEWPCVLDHKWYLSEKAGRDVGIQ
ncbi:MAG: hypothetical protein HY814_06865, partial [Candidatus Riflebacteria bacterium]|nr:hypothetical protein [Candidatus Riflebacteria bacterium]